MKNFNDILSAPLVALREWWEKDEPLQPNPDWPGGLQFYCEYGRPLPPKREFSPVRYDGTYCPFPKEIAERPIINPEDTEVHEEEDVPLNFEKPIEKSSQENCTVGHNSGPVQPTEERAGSERRDNDYIL